MNFPEQFFYFRKERKKKKSIRQDGTKSSLTSFTYKSGFSGKLWKPDLCLDSIIPHIYSILMLNGGFSKDQHLKVRFNIHAVQCAFKALYITKDINEENIQFKKFKVTRFFQMEESERIFILSLKT